MLGDFQLGQVFNGLCVDGASYTAYDYDEGEKVPLLWGEEGLWGCIFINFAGGGGLKESIIAVYINSKFCILVLALGVNGDLAFGGMPIRHRVSRCRRARQLHFGR